MAAAPFLTADIPESVLSLPPRLANDAEVQKLLSDERMRAEQHRMNYLMLKTEHSRLILTLISQFDYVYGVLLLSD
jgi:hypothetical protein